MRNLPENNRKYISFVSRIRNAETNREIREIMEDMSPDHIQKRLIELAKKWGSENKYKVPAGPGSGRKKTIKKYHFEDENFIVKYSPSHEHIRFTRKPYGVVYQSDEGKIGAFKAPLVWRSMNLIEELIINGEIKI